MNGYRVMTAGTRKHFRLGLPGLALIACAVGLLCFSCGGGANELSSSNSADPASSADVPLTSADVTNVVQNAVLSVNAPMVIAVADRAGNILAVFETAGAPTTAVGNFGATVPSDELAVGLARTAAFFSNDQAPL